MSLLTLERSSPSPHESENEDLQSTSSYEGFVARDHYALCLSPRPFTSLGPGRSGDTLRIFSHLKKLVKLLRSEDKLRMAVELENTNSCRKVTKYLVIITTIGHMDTEETVVLGTEQEGSTVRICLVLPLFRDTEIKLDGDGGFSVHTGDRHHVFKPSSVQSMWAALQMMYKATRDAQSNNYYVGGLSHTWMTYYSGKLTTDGAIINEWNLLEDVESFRPHYAMYEGDGTNNQGDGLERSLTYKLREVMLHQDLEEVTSKQLRLLLEEEMKMDLKEHRSFLDQQMLLILGQMERPSQIFDYLYLGSEWNASNLQELKLLGVKYILNISREIDNFYPEEFKYLNIRLYDLPNSELMKHWDKTYAFLKEAKSSGKAVLVHCKMGISRSAATVTAYAMKEYKMSLAEALSHVKSKRNVVNPNDGFISQLQAYEGILKARHNELWGKMAPSRSQSTGMYRLRSQSEPNIPELLNTEDEDEPELCFLEEGGAGNTDTPLLLASSNHLDIENKKLFPLQSHSLSRFPPQSIDKNENIRNFLASLPNIAVEDDPGIGENVCTSESGSGFSSPISSPTDEDRLSSRYKLAKEIRREHRMEKEAREGGLQDEEKEAGESREEAVKLQEQGEVQEAADELQRKISEEEEVSPTKEDVQDTVSATELPPASNQPVPSLPQDSREDTMLAECHQPVANIPIFHGIPRALKSTSLPRNIVMQYQQQDSLTSQNQANVPSLEHAKPPSVPASSEAESMLAEQGSTCISISEIRSECVYEQSLSPSEQSNRDLSSRQKGELDASGPVELPQIYSVPKRIKEIEEMNSIKAFSKFPTASPGDGQSVEKQDTNTDECVAMDDKTAPGIPGSPSSHSVASSLSGGDEELTRLNMTSDNGNSKTAHVTTTRHSSLSPYLPPVPGSDTHVLTSSCSHLPSRHSASSMSTDPSPLPISAGDRVLLVQPGAGAVKARVMTYEEKSRDRDERSTSSDELSMRRASLQFHPSPPGEGTQDMQNISNPEVQELKFLSSAKRRPSSDIIRERGSSSPAHIRRETTPPAFLSAWSKLVDGIPTMPVQDLKKKFEDSDAMSISSSVGSSASYQQPPHPSRQVRHKTRSSSLRRSQSLRDVDSPERLVYKFKGSKGSGKKWDRTSPCSQD